MSSAMLRLLLLFVLLAGPAARSFAQGMPDAVSVTVPRFSPADDSLKGVIWSKTARYIWNIKSPNHPPTVWQTATEFKNWGNSAEAQADKSGLTVLKNQVLGSFGGGAASARQLVDSIVANVSRARKGTELYKVDARALAAELNGIPGVGAASVGNAATASVPAETAETVEAADPLRQQPEASKKVVSAAPPKEEGFNQFIARHPVASLGLTFLVGLLTGALLTMIYRRPPAVAEVASPLLVEEPRIQKPKPISQHGAHNQAKKEAEAMKQVAVPQPAPPPKRNPNPKPAPVQQPAPPPVAIPAVEVSAPVAPAPPTNWYAPAQEGGHIEVRKLVAEALPQLPIMLIIDARNPDRATFTLNPQANQGKLIGDGLEQLRDYFDYELPGRISSVTAAAPGQLVRQGDGWQVSTLARLEVR